MSPGYTWSQYSAWVDCIDHAAANAPSGSGTLKLWQPDVPDILVEISHRHPDWDLTRSLDFQAHRDLALAAAEKMDVVVMSRFFNPSAPEAATFRYQGSLRPEDHARLAPEAEIAFGSWAAQKLSTSGWKGSVCEAGPFWSIVLTRSSTRTQ
jgi:hypothetical protein